MIDNVVRILLLEDRKEEAELTTRMVLKSLPNAMFTVADNKADFMEKIHWAEYNLVLGDYNLPDYNGLEALLYIRGQFPSLPFIFVTGTLNSEEKAADAILRGANGYVLKDNLPVLGDTIINILNLAAEEREKARIASHKRNERKLKLQKASALLGNAPDFADKQTIEATLLEVLKEM